MNDLAPLLDRAAEQGGLVTTAQARRIGVSRLQMSRFERSGSLERVAQGVYRTAGSAPHEHEQILAAWLALERGAYLSERARTPLEGLVVGGASAAALHGIGDLYVDEVELLAAPPGTRRTTRDGIRVRARAVDGVDVVLAHGLPALSVTATLADLAQQRVPLDHLANALRDGEDRVDIARLDALLDPLAVRNGFEDGVAFRIRLYELAGRDPESLAADAARSPLAPLIVLDYLKGIDFASLEALRPSLGIDSSPLMSHLQNLIAPITTSWVSGIATTRLLGSIVPYNFSPLFEHAFAAQVRPMLEHPAGLEEGVANRALASGDVGSGAQGIEALDRANARPSDRDSSGAE